MRRMILVAMAVLLAGCGGGGDPAPDIAIRWAQPSYTVAAGGMGVQTQVYFEGKDAPPIMALDMRSSPAGGPDFGGRVVWVNSLRQAPVTLSASERGTYEVTATATVSGVAYTARATLVAR